MLTTTRLTRQEKLLAGIFPQVRLVDEPRQGVVFARIRGVAEARGEVIACTDADSTVPVDWLNNFATAYADPAVVAVGGTTSHQEKTYLSRVLLLGLWVTFRVAQLMMGYNMSFRTKAYYACGGFDEQVGFGEDAYITQQLKKLGKVVILHGNAVTTSLRRYRSRNWASYVGTTLLSSFYMLVLHRPMHFRLTPMSDIKSLKDPTTAEDKPA
ncbi:MAG: glycosyltransferase family 2 protein [Anaerolineae bacterium]